MTSTGAIRWDSLRSCYGYGRWKIWLKLGKGWSSWSISITSESTVLSRLKMAETIGWPHRSSVVDTTRLFLWSKNGLDGKQKSLKGPWPSVATRGFNQLDARAAYRMSRSRRWHAIRGDRRAGTWRGRICRPAASRRGPGVTQRASISTTSFRRRFFFSIPRSAAAAAARHPAVLVVLDASSLLYRPTVWRRLSLSNESPRNNTNHNGNIRTHNDREAGGGVGVGGLEGKKSWSKIRSPQKSSSLSPIVFCSRNFWIWAVGVRQRTGVEVVEGRR